MTERPVTDRWERGDPYERYIGRWSRRVAPLFLDWLDIPPGRRWLDVGCGTGALSAAVVDRSAPSAVTAVDPSEGFLATVSEHLGPRVAARRGTADDLPLDTASVDAAVSGLVLNFVPDPRAALAELSRVTAPGGTVAAYVWDYADGMQLLRLFWDAAVGLDPAAAPLDEGTRFPLCRPEPLGAAFRDTGLESVEVVPIEVDTVFADVDDLWAPFLGGQGPAPSYVASLDDSARTALRDRLRHRLPTSSDGSVPLRARAWAVRGFRGD
ncbi:methyltransferase domain-containing protein [Actinotalea sp. M2MS4P-6]|uniref:class I SAM-dependent methyltransferase n=1 Tax=Actinotalea sp. M2MS4P-6 TaxID=2983762 RepID=UPI0021E377A8|nr:methyltransferase domain-containing protein [Actinotalea sp. M2MS4P-6]MCV2395255.1 methyltransferase domain-containing protein [Actinotalea sp. M2MS4P-6]